ncbi:hypothetical protein NQ317_016141 [Molorchus minor]|uniref:Uncharacterized protein n=1 Tax=Molorchus minor TaxID=1323400 RepID=A0ABQ9IZX6_9CUCU|nr:hypothetical protein NQ317_016141 [Molorchus minor]
MSMLHIKPFPKSSPLIDILPELFGDYFNPFTRENLNQPLDRGNNEILNTFIKTLRISYEIPGHPQTRRTYRANGIDSAPREKTFKLDNGQSMTVEKLRYSHLPTIWVGSTTNEKRILLPLELCSLVEGQVTNRKMTEGQTSKMIKFTATNTQIRKQKIMDALHRASYNSNNSVREFGFSVANEFEKLEARVLQPPSLEYANKKVVRPSRGVWRGEKFFKPIVINKWTIISVDRRPPRPDDLTRFASEISKNAGFCGMSITAPPDKPFQTIRCLNVNDIKKYFETQKDKRYDVIFVVVPNSGQQYSYVKTAAEINVGCLTQCIKVKTLNKMNQQTAVNILLKVNSKLNGTNHFLCTRPPIMNRPCMIMGADVTHPSPDARGIPSVAAVTASHDPKAFQYNICWRLQPPKVEIIEDLEAITIEQLKYFYNKTKVKPERIIFFRDGVSEGQFDQVRTSEIRAIRSACKRASS